MFCEIDPFCQKVLKKHWPESKIYNDVKTLKTDELGRIDLLTGGFPCQPFSVAGKQGAQDDDRHLWPAMFRIIKECRPSWVVGENVAGIIELGLEQVCADLEGEGYEVWPIVIPACAVNAPHRRDRVWIIAHSNSERLQEAWSEQQAARDYRHDNQRSTPNSDSKRQQRGEERSKKRGDCEKQFERFCNYYDWQNLPKPGISRGDDGLSRRLDRTKSLGNAIVPHVAYEIIKLIDFFE